MWFGFTKIPFPWSFVLNMSYFTSTFGPGSPLRMSSVAFTSAVGVPVILKPVVASPVTESPESSDR